MWGKNASRWKSEQHKMEEIKYGCYGMKRLAERKDVDRHAKLRNDVQLSVGEWTDHAESWQEVSKRRNMRDEDTSACGRIAIHLT
jgi:DNA phosphorothioation-dependent restriction protein DptG